MNQTLIVRGRYCGRSFIPNEPLPDAEGSAELIITLVPPKANGSIADAFGAAPQRRSREDILAQVRADRDEWSDR